MAAPQSTDHKSHPERMRDDFDRLDNAQRQSLWIGLIVSLVIGILIGWFLLGWGLFPVRYEGGSPHQLDQASQADYISAVADAYAARLDEESLALAAYRLRSFLGEKKADEAIQNAIDYFNANPGAPASEQYPTAVNFDSRVRVQNLETLHTDLGLGMDTAETETEAATAVATAVTTQQSQDQSQQKSQGLDWLKWLLGLLAAGVLIYGGVRILRLLTRRNDDEDNEDGSPATTTDAPYDVQPHTTTAGRRPSNTEANTTKDGRSHVYTDDYDPVRDGWEDEPDEDDSPPHLLAPTVDPAEYPDYPFSSEGETPPEERAAEPPVYEEEEDLEEDGGWLHDMGMTAAPASVVANQPKPPAAPASASGKRRGEVIATYTAHYRLGQADYDEIFSLIDPKTQINVGTCGMGVTSPGGYREQHPEEVIALNVWLFDKMDTENVRSYQRVLISEYVIDSGKETDYENIRGAVGKPIVAQSGLDFTIEGENLLMACRVLEANYVQNGASKGVFQDVKIEMNVMKKG